jgi:hypothetical protein
MDAIDLFVTLLEGQDLSKVASAFNEPIRNNNIPLVKTKLKRILRGQLNAPNRRKRRRMNPFEYALTMMKLDSLKSFNEKELFAFLLDPRSNSISDARKFANAFLYQPQKTKEILPELVKNQSEGKPLFTLLVQWERDEEVQEYYIKLNQTENMSLPSHTELFLRFLDKEEERKLLKLKNEAKDWTPKDLFENQCSDGQSPLYLILFAYLLSHDFTNEAFATSLFLDGIYCLLKARTEEIIRIESIAKKSEEFVDGEKKEEIEKLKQAYKILKTDYNQIKKELTRFKKQYDQLEEDNKKKEDEWNKSQEEQHYQFKKQQEILEQNVESLSREKSLLAKKLEDMRKQQEDQQKLFSHVFPEETEEPAKLLVVHGLDLLIVKRIYPEILFVSIRDWPSMRNSLPNSLTCISVQREAVNNRQLREIEQYAIQNNLTFFTLIFRNEKEMIEVMALLKQRLNQ